MTESKQTGSEIRDVLIDALDSSRGHFHLESGQHGDLWLNLERVLHVRVERQQETQALYLAEKSNMSMQWREPCVSSQFLSWWRSAYLDVHRMRVINQTAKH